MSNRRHRSRFATAFLCGSFALSFSAVAQQYSATHLGTLGLDTAQTEAFDINASGQITGYSVNSNRLTHAFIYEGGAMQDLGAPDFASLGYGINARGDVTGYTFSLTTDASHAFHYANGVMRDLGTLGGRDSFGVDINATGQIVGSSATSSGEHHAFVYGDGVMRDIGSLVGYGQYSSSDASAINDAGQITGYSTTLAEDPAARPIGDPIPAHAFVYSNGVMTDIGTLGGEYSLGWDINNAGQITGYSTEADGTSRAFLYSDGIMRRLGTLGSSSMGEGLNNVGQVVGAFTTFENGIGHAFLYSNGEMIDLNTALDRSDPVTMYLVLTAARAINDAGWIVAAGYDTRTHLPQAYLLTPSAVPIPSTILLLLSGLAGLRFRRRR